MGDASPKHFPKDPVLKAASRPCNCGSTDSESVSVFEPSTHPFPGWLYINTHSGRDPIRRRNSLVVRWQQEPLQQCAVATSCDSALCRLCIMNKQTTRSLNQWIDLLMCLTQRRHWKCAVVIAANEAQFCCMLVHFIVNGMPVWCTSLAISFILHYHSFKCIMNYKHSHFILIHILPFLSITLPSNLWGPELNVQPWLWIGS